MADSYSGNKTMYLNATFGLTFLYTSRDAIQFNYLICTFDCYLHFFILSVINYSLYPFSAMTCGVSTFAVNTVDSIHPSSP